MHLPIFTVLREAVRFTTVTAYLQVWFLSRIGNYADRLVFELLLYSPFNRLLSTVFA